MSTTHTKPYTQTSQTHTQMKTDKTDKIDKTDKMKRFEHNIPDGSPMGTNHSSPP